VEDPAGKRVATPTSVRPEAAHVPANVRAARATLVTLDPVLSPPKVTKYQASLAAARATTLARYPAGNPGTVARLNRFVFRRNPPETGAAVDPAGAVPAGGRPPGSR